MNDGINPKSPQNEKKRNGNRNREREREKRFDKKQSAILNMCARSIESHYIRSVLFTLISLSVVIRFNLRLTEFHNLNHNVISQLALCRVGQV